MYLDVFQKFSHNSRSHVIEKGSQCFLWAIKFFHQIGRIKGSFFNTLLKLNRLNMTSNGITKFQARDLSRNQLLGKHCVFCACLCLCVWGCICVCVWHVWLCPTKTLSSKGLIHLQISTVVGYERLLCSEKHSLKSFMHRSAFQIADPLPLCASNLFCILPSSLNGPPG